MIDALAVVEANQYVTLATADADGRPWASPVWFAHENTRAVYWVSRPDARHSRNLAVRPELALVWFDTHAPPYSGGGVYADAVAGQVPAEQLEAAMAVFSARSTAAGAGTFGPADVSGVAPLRLYRATIGELSVLGDDDRRIPFKPA